MCSETGSRKKNQQIIPKIDNLVDEVYERRGFTDADIAFLVTNKRFEDKVKQEAEKYKITVLEKQNLEKIFKKQGGKDSIDNSIYSINLKDYNLNKNIIYF